MFKYIQPAKKSYFFDKGYRDLLNTIKGAWARNRNSIMRYKNNLNNLYYEDLPVKICKGLFNILEIVAVFVFGTCITAIISVANIVVLLIFMLIVYIAFTFIWIVDRIYLFKNKIFVACNECKERSLIPTYICPNCNVKHTKLTPGIYGILKRRCECGEKLPTTFFNGRKELDAECPLCGHKTTDRESRPICIPVVGGRSVGKTAFITAFAKDFIDYVAPNNNLSIEFYNDKKEEIYNEITNAYINGSTRMTERSVDVNTASSVSFSFFVQHPKLSPERLVHVYDIAGEVFTNNDENEVQRQYEYCQGVVLMIDPFAIPSVKLKYEELLEPEDVAGIGKADINGIINSFLNKLRDVTGLSDNKMAKVPLAVIISKIDSASLEDDIGKTAVNKLMNSEPVKFTNFFDTQDYLCREFLKENGMESFLNSISIQFKNNRFFACSAIGHTRDKGEYEPKGVLAPMEWLFKNADSKMAKIWDDNEFSKKNLD